MQRYVYEIRNHSLAQEDWEDADALVAMLVASIDSDMALSLTDGATKQILPASVAMFLLDGLLRLCGEDEISLVVLAAKGRLRVKEIAEILQDKNSNVRHRLRTRDLTALRVTDTTHPYYDQNAILEHF
jgi:hypothetical protein